MHRLKSDVPNTRVLYGWKPVSLLDEEFILEHFPRIMLYFTMTTLPVNFNNNNPTTAR
jgi:hypothetical protein